MFNEQRLGSVTKEILGYVALGTLCYIALSSPIGAEKITKILWKETKNACSGYLGRRIKHLRQAGYISTQGGDVKLTKRGQTLLARAQIDELKIEHHQWDHIWRCVAYDVPNSFTWARRAFHRKLIDIGFVQVQKSVLVCPYRSDEVVGIIARLYEIDKYILFMEANDIPSASRLKTKFGLV